MNEAYDLIIIGAGSAGLTAARFAGQLGARVALVEGARLGGDCTWTGCVPSKALIRAAGVAHTGRTAARFGVQTGPVAVDMPAVQQYVAGAVDSVAATETAAIVRGWGVELIAAPARFRNAQTVQAGDATLHGRQVLICSGATPAIPAWDGLSGVPYLTYETFYDNRRLSAHLIVVGGGPQGVEMSQAYRRLGAAVTLVSPSLLPGEEPQAAAVLEAVLAQEGVTRLRERATGASRQGEALILHAGATTVAGDMLLIATGRSPRVKDLDLERAGVTYSGAGIPVDDQLRTNVAHIYAAGDCLGGPQYTHYAGWQAFQAVRNALLPGSSRGHSDALPHVTYTDPEVARVGCTEAAARTRWGDGVAVAEWPLAAVDRAVCDGTTDGFVKLIHRKGGELVGATIVAPRAGEAITECVVALQQGLGLAALAGSIHAYPTYATPVQQLAAGVVVAGILDGLSGKVLRTLAQRAR